MLITWVEPCTKMTGGLLHKNTAAIPIHHPFQSKQKQPNAPHNPRNAPHKYGCQICSWLADGSR